MIDIGGLRNYRARLDRDRPTTFAGWPVEPPVREACWQALADTVDALIDLGPEPPVGAVSEVLRRGVEAYDGLHGGSFTKPEREDICRHLYEIGDLAGLDAADEWVEAWRQW